MEKGGANMGEYELAILTAQIVTLVIVILILFRMSRQYGIKTDLPFGKK